MTDVRDKPFLRFLEKAKAQGLIKDFEYNDEDRDDCGNIERTAKIQPYFTIRPIVHIKFHEEY
jgi:hypothetical protein